MEIVNYIAKYSNILAGLVCVLRSPTNVLNTQFLAFALANSEVQSPIPYSH